MTLVCSKCRRVNPSEASYCYYDGAALASHGGTGGPLNAAVVPFPREFVFPSGRQCRNFNELGMACVQEWRAAKELLAGGYLETFLGGMGRMDLAVAAKQAAAFPDQDRGLDMLLDKFPCQVLQPAQLQVEPQNVSLGVVHVGQDAAFEVHIQNAGMRLLYGTITVENTPWLAVGDPPVTEKAFHCERDYTVHVRIDGKKLKASKSPLEGRIVIDSNGGQITAVVKVEVPVKPFPSGVLAGARTQRQLAEMAFKQPKEAAPLFESGQVAKWYADNGWVYGVQGPAATGLAAVQQFLEACGLTTAPRVEIDQMSITLKGPAGGRLEHALRVKAIEPKPVFAYASCDQAWLIPKAAVLSGRTATIPLEIPEVPMPLEGNEVKAQLVVTSNGRQKFYVGVRLRVEGEVIPLFSPVGSGASQLAANGGPAIGGVAMLAPSAGVLPPPQDTLDFTQSADDLELLVRRRPPNEWLHLMPLALLLLALTGILAVDFFREKPALSNTGSSVVQPYGELPGLSDPKHYLRIEHSLEPSQAHRFGIVQLNAQGKPDKQLTFEALNAKGRTNNTVVRVEGTDFIFGRPRPGTVASVKHGGRPARPIVVEEGRTETPTYRSIWVFPEPTESGKDADGDPVGVKVTQEVSLRRSDVTGRLETVLVRYRIDNTCSKVQKVGLRFMLDTFIGTNDGVAFTIPDEAGLMESSIVLPRPGKQMPYFVQALEHPNLQNPGTVAHLTLRIADPRLDEPDRVVIAAWPNRKLGHSLALDSETLWEVPVITLRQLSDSAATIYWNEKPLEPGKSREMAFAYGLGRISGQSAEGGKPGLAVTVGGNLRPNGEFLVVATIENPQQNQRAAIHLPQGFQLVQGAGEQAVPRSGAKVTVTWRVRAGGTGGDFPIRVSSGGLERTERVRIAARSFLD